MPTHRLGSTHASALTTAALIALALASPAAARDAGERAGRAAERLTRVEERVSARNERRAAREAQRAARLQQRAERRAPSPTPSSTGETASVTSTRGCSLTIETSAARITAGETVSVFGKVSCPTGTNAGDRQVTIEQSPLDGAARSFLALGKAQSETDGSYQLPPQALQANTIFRARLGRHGAHTSVRVAPAVTLSATGGESSPTATPASAGGHAHPARRDKATFSGTATPAADGARVALQVAYAADGEQWRTIAFGQVQEGRFSISHAFKIPGEAKVRAIVHPRGGNAPGVSEAVAYTVPAPQNPQLTIEASADPIAFGSPVTLSGVAAGASAQSVTLLARTAGGSFAPLTTAETDPSGDYSFQVSPTQSSYYEVSDATSHSVALFEGVKYVLALDPPPASITAGQPLSIVGSLAPTGNAGQTVYLERRGGAGIGFHAIASATVQGDGSFTLSHVFETATSATLRVRVGSDAQLQGSASPAFTVTVGAAPASTLAPEAGAPEPAPIS